MTKFPEWLPAEVAIHVQTLINKGGLGEMEKPLMRLVTAHGMDEVWATLEALSKDNAQPLIDFLETVRLHPSVTGGATDLLNVPGDAVQRKMFLKLAVSCDDALKSLRQFSSQDGTQAGWSLLERALHRHELSAVEKQEGNKLAAIRNLQSHLQKIQQDSSIVEVLETIQDAAFLAIDAPVVNLPKKRNAKRADIVLLATDLSYYIRQHFNKPLHEVVASTVNAALNLYDAIDGNYVQKLKRR